MGPIMRLQTSPRRFALAAITLSAMAALPAVSQTINEDLKLLPTDGIANDWFGRFVAISGTTAVVGAYRDDGSGSYSGSAYLFDTTTGLQIAILLPNDGVAWDWFGRSVAISGNTAIVGAMQDDDNGSGSGSAYLFDTTTGQQTAKLLPNDGESWDEFGVSVAISGTTAVVGAYQDRDNGSVSGSAYLFDTTTGQQIAKLLPSDGAALDIFGWSVAISGTTAIVGAPGKDDNGASSGSAYPFDTMTGQQIDKLLPSDGEPWDQFGESVAISGTTAVVGARYDDDNGYNSGSAYLFDTTTGQQIDKLLPSDGAESDSFGYAVAINGTTAVVGAFQDDDNGSASGSAYLFSTSTGQQIAKLLPSDGATADLFGNSVAISGSTTVVGAYGDDANGTNSGSAYVFTSPSLCPADLTGDGTLNFFDVAAFLTEFTAIDPIADFTGDGSINFFDVAAFLTEFTAGCP